MYTLIASIARLLAPVQGDQRSIDPVRRLMERAEARAGQNPRQARELRQAAQAWLRVIR